MPFRLDLGAASKAARLSLWGSLDLVALSCLVLVFVFVLAAQQNTTPKLRRRRKGTEEDAVTPSEETTTKAQASPSSAGGHCRYLTIALLGVFALLFYYYAPQREGPSDLSGTQWVRRRPSQCPVDESEVDPEINLLLAGLYGDLGESYWYGNESSKQQQVPFPSVSTQSKVAEELFRQGVMHMYGFNRVEARRNFKTATVLAPSCVMCWWGLANVYTHSINEPSVTPEEFALGKKAIEEAWRLLKEQAAKSTKAGPSVEAGFVTSLRQYYGGPSATWTESGKDGMLLKYVNRLRSFCTSIDMHTTCASLLAEGLLKQTSWQYYTLAAGSNHEMRTSSLKPNAREAAELLENVFERNPKHPLALHLWIHLKEATDHPEEAESAADLLAEWPRGVSHLVHMSGHIYHRLGRYQDSIQAGLASIQSDEHLESECLAPYAPQHNIALMQHSAMMVGHSDLALKYAMNLEDMPLDYSQAFTGVWSVPKELIHCRFGRWSEIDQREQAVPSSTHFSTAFTAAISEYARGLAQAAVGQFSDAKLTLSKLKNATSNIAPGFFPRGHAFFGYYEELGEIMGLVLEARLDLDLDSSPRSAIEKLSKASQIQHDMAYIEPEFWYMPVKQCLGAVLLEAKDYQAAIHVYEEDLIEHPENGFSIVGLANALSMKEQGQGLSSNGNGNQKDHEKQLLLQTVLDLKQRFAEVWAAGAQAITGSCCELGFC
jgi:tetratricopeptide (TPR) repeat protein